MTTTKKSGTKPKPRRPRKSAATPGTGAGGKRQYHFICGLPRAGSTLFCNILNQNPAFFASSTSEVSAGVMGLQQLWSTSFETKGKLIHDKEAAQTDMANAVRGFVDGYYKRVDRKVIFDKSRGWTPLAWPIHKNYFPGSKIFVMVRDPRDVLASIEKHHLDDFPAVSDSPLGEDTLLARARRYFDHKGMVGGPIRHVEDTIRRKTPNIVLVKFEDLVKNPEEEMRVIYAKLRMDYFAHDFDKVEAQSTEVDGLYMYKFPHEGKGKVQPPKTPWSDWLSDDVAEHVLNTWPAYAKAFHYGNVK